MSNRMNSRIASLWSKFKNKVFRDAFSNTQLATGIAAQIQTMREDRNLTQTELAEASGMAQSRVSLLEDPSYDRMSIGTLKRVASALDVALLVKFVPYSEILRDAVVSSENKFAVQSFAQDTSPVLPSSSWNATAFLRTSDAGFIVKELAAATSKNAITAAIASRPNLVGASRAIA